MSRAIVCTHAGTGSGGSIPNADSLSRELTETWIVLELCNFGSLQVRDTKVSRSVTSGRNAFSTKNLYRASWKLAGSN